MKQTNIYNEEINTYRKPFSYEKYFSNCAMKLKNRANNF